MEMNPVPWRSEVGPGHLQQPQVVPTLDGAMQLNNSSGLRSARSNF